MSIPQTHRAVTVIEQGKVAVQERPLPALDDDSILVRVRTVALNPTDFKHIDGFEFGVLPPGASTGSDFAGDIIHIGANAQGKGFKIGDAVAGCIPGGRPADNGTFQEYIRVHPEAIFLKGPLSYEDAAPGGVAMTTAAMALFGSFATPVTSLFKPDQSEPLLIWAGSTGVGLYAIKFASLAGYRVVTTASPRNFDLLKSLGAAEVFDYNDPEVVSKIQAWVREQNIGPLRKAIDCYTDGPSTDKTAAAFEDGQGEVIVLLYPKNGPTTVKTTLIVIYESLKPENEYHKAVRELYDNIPRLAEEGKLGKGTIPLHIWPKTGLDAIPAALDHIRSGKHSAQKVIVHIA